MGNLKISRKNIFIIVAIASLVPMIFAGFLLLSDGDELNTGAGSDFPESSWYQVNNFQGYQTKLDPTKISKGANPTGQNTTVGNGDKVAVREWGYEVLGTVTTTEEAITSLHTFRRRDGENIIMRSRGTYLEYFEEDNDRWESLRTTSTDEAVYDYADYNINTDLRSYVYFGNAADNFARWTGAHSLMDGAVTTADITVTVDDATDFLSSGTIRYCDTDQAYASISGNIITLSASSTVACADDRSVTQAVEEFPANPKGNIYLNANNRIFIAGVTSTPQAVFFSAYGDAETYLTTLVSNSTADAAGIFNLGEGGGEVKGMVLDEGSIYIFKKAIIYSATLTDALYTIVPLKPFDGKSQTTGADERGLVFTGGNGVYFTTPDNEIMNLSRVADVDYPQIVPISDIIKPTTDLVNFSGGSGITWKDRAFFSIKSASDITVQDSILVWNDRTDRWDSPIIGWSASDFTVYDDTSDEALYFGDASTANVYKVITTDRLDNNFPFTASWRSRQFNFSDVGIPASEMKEMNNVYVEGYITENTKLYITLLLDEGGFSQSFTTDIEGTDSDYLFDTTPLNPYGQHPFGYLPFGTSDAVPKKKFRVYLNRDFRVLPFYNAQIEFLSEDENNFWEVTEFGFKVQPASQPEKRNLYKQFN